MSLEPLPPAVATLAREVSHLRPDATMGRHAPESIRPPSVPASPEGEGSLPRITLAEDTDLDIVRVLGEGGLGRVMLARQRSLGREVAVKIARDRERGSAGLRREARTMGRLEHPNVIPVHAIGLDDEGGVVLVMKHIEGVEWRALLRDPDARWWERLGIPRGERRSFHLDVLAQVANALHYAHGRGVIHRDVKPENVLIGAHGDVYLADWGVASLPRERVPDAMSVVVGTPAYMAPEMVLGDPTQVSERTDVFLLGATLHEILSGAPPYAADEVAGALMAAFRCTPPAFPDDVPAELAALARAAMEREPSERPESALAFRQALDAWRAHRGAMGLSERARATFRDARALMEERSTEALAEVDRKLVEARFGFTQALREWPEYEAAREGLRHVLVLTVEHDIARESLQAARAHLAEIEDPPPAVVAAVDALEARQAQLRLDRERLEAMERDRDLSVASSERRAFLGFVLASALMAMGSIAARRVLTGERAGGHGDLIGFPLVLLLVVILVVVVRRRRPQNAVGASLLRAVLGAVAAVVVNRVLGAVSETPVHALLTADCLIYAGVLFTLRSLVPRLPIFSAWLVLGAIFCTLLPSYAPIVFALTMFTMLTTLYVGWHWFMHKGTAGTAHPELDPSRDG